MSLIKYIAGIFTRSPVVDSATAVGHTLDTTNTLSTAGAKIASWKNNTTEMVFIDKDGVLDVSGSGDNGRITLDSSQTPNTYIQADNNGYEIEFYTRYSTSANLILKDILWISSASSIPRIAFGSGNYGPIIGVVNNTPATLNGAGETRRFWIAPPYGGDGYENDNRHAVDIILAGGQGGDPDAGVTTGGNAAKVDVILGSGGTGFGGAANGSDGAFRIQNEAAATTIFEVRQAQSIGFFAATPVAQQSSTGETTGFTAGAGTAVNDDSTFTGNVGSTAYRINDIVKALKNYGLLAL